MKKTLTFLSFLFFCLTIRAAEPTAIDSLAMYHEATALNSGKIQQEMIYLHLDNTSYYRGDRIFFACYLVTSGHLKPSNLSQTVYVELLNPNGKIIDRCVLRPEGGRCHGSLLADETPFYSGYYEIRAYTRYMLNFGQQAMYSRVIPMFAEPKEEGDWADRRMLKYGSAKHQFSRPKPVRIVSPKKTDEDIDVRVEAKSDSVVVTVLTDKYGALGATFSCRGELCGRAILDLSGSPDASFSTSRSRFPTGVIQLTLFSAEGKPVAERLFFNNREDFISMEYEFDKTKYGPYEPVELTVRLSKPVMFSLSVTDASNHVEYNSDIRSDLLLGPELRGFVPNLGKHISAPDSLLAARGRYRYSWNHLAGMEPYDIVKLPEQGIEVHGSVQGSLRNKGKSGVTISMMLNSMSNDSTSFIDEFLTDSVGNFAFRGDLYGDWMMTLSATEKGKRKRHRILLDRSERPAARAYDVEEMQYALADAQVMLTDSVDSDEELLQQLERKGVKRLKEVKVTANAGHAADVRQYVENAVASYDVASARNLLQDRGKKFIRRVSDILPLLDPKFHFSGFYGWLYGTKAPLYVIENELGNNDKVLQYSDLNTSMGLAADISVDMVKNIYINNQRHAIEEYGVRSFEEDPSFADTLVKKDMYERPVLNAADEFAIQMKDYHAAYYRDMARRQIGCVIFIELNTNNSGFIRPGMRRTIVEGYTEPEAFRHANYADAPPAETDYRRTLYWNPEVMPDRDGVARIRFFNNSSARTFNVDAALLAPDGTLGGI